MKKIYLLLLPLAVATAACSDNDEPKPVEEPQTVITFEDCAFDTGKTNNLMSTPDGTIADYSEADALFFGTDLYTQIAGAIVSNRKNVSKDGSGLPIDISVSLNGETAGADGSDKYCYMAWHSYTSEKKGIMPEFSFSEGQERELTSLMLMNSTLMSQFMKYGFYSQPGLGDGDYVSIIIKGYDAAGNPTGNVDVVIGDRRDGKQEYIEDWTKIDLSALGSINKIEFDIDTHGWNIPTAISWSVCIDNIAFKTPKADQ